MLKQAMPIASALSLARGAASLLQQWAPIRTQATAGLVPLDGTFAPILGFLDFSNSALLCLGTLVLLVPKPNAPWNRNRTGGRFPQCPQINREHWDAGANQLYQDLKFTVQRSGKTSTYKFQLFQHLDGRDNIVEVTRATSLWIASFIAPDALSEPWSMDILRRAAIATIARTTLAILSIILAAGALIYCALHFPGDPREKAFFVIAIVSRALLCVAQICSIATYSLWHKGLVTVFARPSIQKHDDYESVPWLLGWRVIKVRYYIAFNVSTDKYLTWFWAGSE